jgi:hypothetical protein
VTKFDNPRPTVDSRILGRSLGVKLANRISRDYPQALLAGLLLAACSGPDEPNVQTRPYRSDARDTEQTGGAASKAVRQTDVKPIVTEAELQRMMDYLDEISANAVKSVTTESGDIIDCIELEKQPSLQRPEMIGRAIRFAPTDFTESETLPNRDAGFGAPAQIEGADACEPGTIPQLRISIETLKNFGTLDAFFRKIWEPPALERHDYGVTTRFVTNQGSRARLNLWSPFTELSSEFSLTQLWVSRGSGSDFQSVETGMRDQLGLFPACFRELMGAATSPCS